MFSPVRVFQRKNIILENPNLYFLHILIYQNLHIFVAHYYGLFRLECLFKAITLTKYSKIYWWCRPSPSACGRVKSFCRTTRAQCMIWRKKSLEAYKIHLIEFYFQIRSTNWFFKCNCFLNQWSLLWRPTQGTRSAYKSLISGRRREGKA